MKLLKSLNEYSTLLIVGALFWISPYLLRWIDPTAGTYDAGVLQVPLITIIQFCIFQAFTWITIKMVWPSIGQYFENIFSTDFNDASKWQKLLISLSVYFFLFAFLVILSRVM